MLGTTDVKRKPRKDLTCTHCGKKGHVKEKCYKIIGFLEDFKFTKGKPHVKKGAAVNSFTTAVEPQPDDNQANHVEEIGGSSSMSQMTMLKQQVNKLMDLLNENGLISNDGKSAPANT